MAHGQPAKKPFHPLPNGDPALSFADAQPGYLLLVFTLPEKHLRSGPALSFKGLWPRCFLGAHPYSKGSNFHRDISPLFLSLSLASLGRAAPRKCSNFSFLPLFFQPFKGSVSQQRQPKMEGLAGGSETSHQLHILGLTDFWLLASQSSLHLFLVLAGLTCLNFPTSSRAMEPRMRKPIFGGGGGQEVGLLGHPPGPT